MTDRRPSPTEDEAEPIAVAPPSVLSDHGQSSDTPAATFPSLPDLGPTQPTRIPNLLHLLLFLALTLLAFILSEAAVLAASRPAPLLLALENQRLQLTASALTYALALAASWFVFPALWHQPFLHGIRWNAARARWPVALFGLLLGFGSQAVSTLLPIPKNLPIDTFFRTRAIVFFLAAFGTLVAPLFEEILFRGFLLPALAIAVDWLRLPRSLDALTAWRLSEALSRPALIGSSILTSLLFALIHAPQLGYTWAAVSLLFAISLILCFIRIRTGSVAASTLVHSCYNLSVFLTLFVTTSGFRHLDHL